MRITLEFVRTVQGGDPYAFSFATQEYLLRSGGGGYATATLAWDDGLREQLVELQSGRATAEVVARMGTRLRAFLAGANWEVHERDIGAALAAGDPVELVIRSSAAELYALPWELLSLRSTGQHLGELPSVAISYEWPGTGTAAPAEASTRVLVAWSAAGGAVPAGEHVESIRAAAEAAGAGFDVDRDVLEHATPQRLADRLEATRPTVLHLLAHGAERGGSVGIAMDGADGPRVLTAGDLRRLIAPHAATLRTVVLCACRSGDPGRLGSNVGSLAQALHRAGIEHVVASRFPLATAAATRMTGALYGRLLTDGDVPAAFAAARRRLAPLEGLDWASLQLHRRVEEAGSATTPSPAPPETSAVPAPGPKTRPPWGILAGLGVVLAAVAFAMATGGSDEPTPTEVAAADPPSEPSSPAPDTDTDVPDPGTATKPAAGPTKPTPAPPKPTPTPPTPTPSEKDPSEETPDPTPTEPTPCGPGSITVTKVATVDGPWFVTVNGKPAKIRGTTYAAEGLAAGRHQLLVSLADNTVAQFELQCDEQALIRVHPDRMELASDPDRFRVPIVQGCERARVAWTSADPDLWVSAGFDAGGRAFADAGRHAFTVTVGASPTDRTHRTTGVLEVECGDELTVRVSSDGTVSSPTRPSALSEVQVTPLAQ